jgi:glycosyltransferase involved in cell wall biosynthesis
MICLSIIIPIFNSEEYLVKCLDSVIHQTYNNLEIILVNDGSTDSSTKIIDDYASKDKRIVAIHKENGGIGSAYKTAFEVMTGDYVLFVDSDDWLELDACKILTDIVNKETPDFIHFGLRTINTSGEVVKFHKTLDSVETQNQSIIKNHFEYLKHPSLCRLYKRVLFEGVTIFEQNIGIDEMLTPQLLAKCNRAVYTSKVLYNVFMRENSVSRITYSDKKISDTIRVYQFLCEFAKEQIPDYADYLRIKNLVVSYSLYAQNIRGHFNLGDEMTLRLANEFKSNYSNFKGSKLYKKQGLPLRFQVCLLYRSPGLFKIFQTVIANAKAILR